MVEKSTGHALKIDNLHVYYGQSHALQGVTLTLGAGVLSVVGRNGMGKTTLCNTIMGLTAARQGTVRVFGRSALGLEPHRIYGMDVAYVPQGRRCWADLTVDEHLRLVQGRDSAAAWTIERVYETFPRLAERRGNGGTQLSGGEQQMLAISRALLGNPRLLIMDEPTEGLAPVIVDQLRDLLIALAQDNDMAILLVEQNIGVATTVADQVAIMINGRINRVMPASELAADRDLQQRLLGVGRHGEDDTPEVSETRQAVAMAEMAQVFQVSRAGDMRAPQSLLPERWRLPADGLRPAAGTAGMATDTAEDKVFAMPLAERVGRRVIVAGTFDTKARELTFMADKVRALGLPVRTVDLSTSGKPVSADVSALQVAAMARGGPGTVMTGDRGASVTAMGQAFARWIVQERGIGGVLSAGGSGGTSIVTPGMRALPFGIPKIMVSTVASGDVGAFVGASDIMMVYSVADVQGLNQITEQVLSNAAHAMAGMVARLPGGNEQLRQRRTARPALGFTMFGVTTPAVQAVTRVLESDYDCLVFHATGTGGRSMEALADSGLMTGIIDLTTTEVADMIVGGTMPATPDRFGAVIRTGLPYVGSVGAVDMVNFGARDTVPERFANRRFVAHNAHVTLMRTTAEENRRIGAWIGQRLVQMPGPVRFLLPEGGVSALDAPGQPFLDPEARAALFTAIEDEVRSSPHVQVQRVPAHINDPAFADAVVAAFRAIAPRQTRTA
ncbi:MAG: Tm-1-like ATP-binding domain-containing protein [Pararhodobacter sp.]